MQGKKTALAALIGLGACAAIALSAASGFAQDKASPTGTWTWTRPGRNGAAGPTMSLKLKADGSKLTGTLTTPGRNGGDPTDTPISEGKVDGDKISFAIVTEGNNGSRTNKYEGKIVGDTLTGTQTGGGRGGRGGGGGGMNGGGTNAPAGGAAGTPWEAKRSK